MTEIVIYTKTGCPFCRRAKELLTSKGARLTEIDVLVETDRFDEMVRRSGGRTTAPQIFIGERHVGGSDDLGVLDATGELDRLLRDERTAGAGEPVSG